MHKCVYKYDMHVDTKPNDIVWKVIILFVDLELLTFPVMWVIDNYDFKYIILQLKIRCSTIYNFVKSFLNCKDIQWQYPNIKIRDLITR